MGSADGLNGAGHPGAIDPAVSSPRESDFEAFLPVHGNVFVTGNSDIEGHARVVVLLCGPPGAGKTTAAHESGLVVFDRDDPEWLSERMFTAKLAELAWQSDARAVVIRAGASSSARAKAARLIGATHVFLLTLDRRELGHRIARRGRADVRSGLASVRSWFDDFDRRDGVQDFPGWDAIGERGLSIGATSRAW